MPPLPTILRDSPLRSRAWRLANLYTIKDDKGRLVPFLPNYTQRQFYNGRHYCNHVLKARKLGLSTFLEVEMADAIIFNPTHTGGIIDYTLPDAKKKLEILANCYRHLDNGDIHPETWKLGKAIKSAIPAVTDAKEEFTLANGSTVFCGTSLRGSTPNRLHISELGKTAIWAPIKAKEIIEGAVNSITPGNVCDIETTHEGGKIGDNYRLMRIAMDHDPATLTAKDFKFHFFPWFDDPRYVLPVTRPIRPEILNYFADLRKQLGRDFTPEQMMFYDATHQVQGHGMKKEFPSTPGEAFEAIVEGAFYGTQMADLRAAGRICDFGQEMSHPLFTFWDIGMSDFTSIWLIQVLPRAILVLDWFETEGTPATGMPDQILRLEAKWGRPIARHFLPHDSARTNPNNGISYVSTLAQGGIRNTTIVPRIPDVLLGIGFVRDVLPHCWFHKTNCDTSRHHNGEEFPSGIACLEGYSRNISPTVLREMPKHDLFSHSADAFRTFAEAKRLGLIETHAEPQRKPTVKGGPRSRR